MQCPACNQRLQIGKVTYTTEGEIAYCNQPLICVNPQCEMYGGKDLSNPTKVVDVKKHKLN